MALIGLISDVHATPAPVEEALAIFDRAGVEQVFCAGDIAGYRDRLKDLERDLRFRYVMIFKNFGRAAVLRSRVTRHS